LEEATREYRVRRGSGEVRRVEKELLGSTELGEKVVRSTALKKRVVRGDALRNIGAERWEME